MLNTSFTKVICRPQMFFGRLQFFCASHKLALILVTGIAVRLILMPIAAHPFDMYVWYNVSNNVLANGSLFLQGFPPLWYHYFMIPVAYSYSALSTVIPTCTLAMSSLPSALDFYPSYSVSVVPGLLFNFVVKIPFLISDILVAFLLYKLVSKVTGQTSLGQSAVLLWFLNPFVIWISSAWGMWDTLPALFSLASLYLLVKRRYGFSAVFLSLGVAAKLYPALFLVPIAFYLYKTSRIGEFRQSFARFFGVFFGASLLLFLPYLGSMVNFVADFFLLSGGNGVDTIVPLGPYSFGLTYWSLTQYLGLTGDWVLFVSVVSLVLVCVTVLLMYWRSSKFSFNVPALDLSVVMLFCVAALLLSYRIVCEQWLVWLMPFFVVLCAVGRLRRGLFWGVSLVGLLYAVLNCPLPFFFLSLAPWIQNSLVGMVYFVWWFDSLWFVVLAVLAVVFSLLLLISVWRLNRQMH